MVFICSHIWRSDVVFVFPVSKIAFISVCFADDDDNRLKKLPCFILLENVKGFETSSARLEFAQFGCHSS